MNDSSYMVGIDLGTTNCAVSYVQPAEGAEAAVRDFPVTQLRQPGEVMAQPLLPSCLYLPGAHELPPGSTSLPWAAATGTLAGEFAKWQGARVPGRLITSAKSWLCHDGVDRHAPILPWGGLPDVAKISPVEASAALLRHLVHAWDTAHPEAPLAAQEVVVTVPASFDEVARALTVQAARCAGLEKLTLVEEPQAAFYDFTARHRHDLVDALNGVKLVLVVDVGGGTTDLTLIQVEASSEGPVLRRLAVSDHLMLGGDNMDAALARLAEERLMAGGRKLSANQWAQLVQVTRAAKEALLGAQAPERCGLAVAGEGSRLVGRTLSTELTREEVERVVVEGFFQHCAASEAPSRAARMALQELGLPYAQDPAITRHLAAFLRKHATTGFAALGIEAESFPAGLPRPDAILLNGGVFNSASLTARLLAVMSAWWPEAPPLRLLAHDSLELAVARGAAYYGLVRHGLGRKIGGGAAHAFYVGLANEPGRDTPRAICLIPHGQEEGVTVDLTSRTFALHLGQPVQFPLYSTTSDRIHHPGDLVDIDYEFRPLPPIHTLLKSAQAETATIPVHLRATLTELGTLELWCVAAATEERWRLEFELRGATVGAAATVTEAMPARFGEACAAVARMYGRQAVDVSAKEVKQLPRTLEAILGPRANWRLPVLRELWSTLYTGAADRHRSPEHERVFFQLIGYALRPGFGYPLDAWRCDQTFLLFADGVKAQGDQRVWNDYWVMWRRLAGGLSETLQQNMWATLKPHLARRVPLSVLPLLDNAAAPLGGLDEMVRAAASLEHVQPAEKVALGNWILDRISNPAKAAGPWAWALGRLGARRPLYGSSHKTLSPEVVEPWVEHLLALDWHGIDGLPFAVVQLTRLTGDRTRDLEQEVRQEALAALQAAQASAHWVEMVTTVIANEVDDEARAFGDTLPIGLRL